MTTQAAIYCRISRDREGEGLGVERQEKECRALAERLGWEVQRVYVDNDISAYSGKARPGYRAMLADVEAGRVRGILVWHIDRLYRRVVDLEEVIRLVEDRDLPIATVQAGDINLNTTNGRTLARVSVSIAQGEVENTRDRIRSQKGEAAEQGRYRGGPRPYGYERDGVTVREAEAVVVREATTAVLAGRSLSALARDLNDRGLTTSTGRAWTHQRLRDVLVRPRNAGLLSTGRDRGTERLRIIGPAKWPALVDEEAWQAVHALLTDPARSHQQGNATRWLGAGIYTCGVPLDGDGDGEVCGGLLRAAPHGGTKMRPYPRRYLYRCVESAHLTVSADHTDGYVRQVVARMVRDPRVVAAMTAGEDDTLAADRERRSLLALRLRQTEADYDEDLIDARRYKAKVERITTELAEVEERLAQGVQAATVSPVFAELDPGAAFLAAPVDVQRAVLRSVLAVRVLPHPGPRGAAWSSDRLLLSPVLQVDDDDASEPGHG